MKLTNFQSIEERRNFLEKKLGIDLKNIGQVLEKEDEEKIHCENRIGDARLPLGVAGPLEIKNLKFKIKNYYIPLATTEGALVASVNRGCKAISLCGGVTTLAEDIGATRGPVFQTAGINESLKFKKWLNDNFILLAKEAKKTSSYLRLKKLSIRMVGDNVFVRFYFNTIDAMGMNMATTATASIIRIIEKKTKVKCLSITGNFCIDKKPAWLNFISGRGKQIWAEVILTKKVLKDFLKTTGEKIFNVWLAKCMVGSAMSGSLGFNAHFANVVAAFFAASGQDLAHVVEGSMGVTTTKILADGNLYFSIYMPAVMLATVGGGTKLKTQQEALSIIGVKKSIELAEILAGAVLAGEVSLLASLAEGTLVKAHERLGR